MFIMLELVIKIKMIITSNIKILFSNNLSPVRVILIGLLYFNMSG